MTLEPVTITEDGEVDPELLDMTRRFWISVVLTILVIVLAIGHMIGLPMHAWIPSRLGPWLELVLATPVVLWGGKPFFVRVYRSITTLHLNMFTLIALGTGAAWAYSLVATLAPGIFPNALRTVDGVVPVYFEAAAAIVTLVLLGQVLELRVRHATSGAIRALLGLAAKTAQVVRDDGAPPAFQNRPQRGPRTGNPLTLYPHPSRAPCPDRAKPCHAWPRAVAAGRRCVLGEPPSPAGDAGMPRGFSAVEIRKDRR